MIDLRKAKWLALRLSRMYPAEVPYRIQGVVRCALQRAGMLDARNPPVAVLPAQGRSGAWVFSAPQLDNVALLQAADLLLSGELEVFGKKIPVGSAKGIPWNCDPVTNTEIPHDFGLSLDFRHLGLGVDIKFLWELNRHLWWVTLAQAYAVTCDGRYLARLTDLIHSWLRACPYPLGANWSSPVEHGIRLINWSLVWHLVGDYDSPMFDGAAGRDLRESWLRSVFQHMHFARSNYSLFSSADNHLVGEAAGIYVGALTWPFWEEARSWKDEARQILEREAAKQFCSDGGNREQAVCYQKFSLEFMLAAGLCGRASGEEFSPGFWGRLEAGIVFLAALMDPAGNLPAIGDSDNAKVFSLGHGSASCPYRSLIATGARLFGRRDLAAKGHRHQVQADWLLPGQDDAGLDCDADSAAGLPQSFPESGYLILGTRLQLEDEIRVVLDAGPLGYNRVAGHGHADALSVLLSVAGIPFLIDPGTYCYNAEPALRKYFRGTSAHNTVEIDGADQSIYGGSFLWLRDVQTTIDCCDLSGALQTVQASHDGYLRLADPVRHHREVRFDTQSEVLWVFDRFTDCKKSHRAHCHWHFSPDCEVSLQEGSVVAARNGVTVRVTPQYRTEDISLVCGRSKPPLGWASRSFYQIEAATTAVVVGRAAAGLELCTIITIAR